MKLLANNNNIVKIQNAFSSFPFNLFAISKRLPTKEDFSLDVEAIKNRLSEKTAGVLINSPNNPTGKIYSKDDIESLSKALKEQGAKSGRTPYLIADEPYRKIVYGGKTVTPVFPYYENAVVVSSFAKDLSLPGERLGYIAVNPACENAEEFIQACIFCTRTLGYVNAPGFFQRVIAKAWDAEADYSSSFDLYIPTPILAKLKQTHPP